MKSFKVLLYVLLIFIINLNIAENSLEDLSKEDNNSLENPSKKNNNYFFKDKSVEVYCNLCPIADEVFKGKATLFINKLDGTKLKNYYEIILKNLDGRCTVHNNINKSDCLYSYQP